MNNYSEQEMISALAKIFATPNELPVGIGDDGAVLPAGNGLPVICADMAVEGVHFKREWSTLGEIGAKIAAANLADIFAMGAVPKYLVVTAGLPRGFTSDELAELSIGIKSEAQLVGAAVVGGDLSSSPVLTISITALGYLPEGATPITRAGAKAGEKLILSGLTGRSAAGLAALEKSVENDFVAQHKKPIVSYQVAASMAQAGVSSMIDTSDGLLSEAHHLAAASGVRIEIDSESLKAAPHFSELAAAASRLGIDVWEWILTGGEDHEFLATTSKVNPDGAFVIGEILPGNGVEVLGVSANNKTGWTHFN